MVVSFSVGKQSEKVVNSLKKMADNIDFFSYDSVQELIREANLRRLSFKRIVLSAKILDDVERDLTELNNYIKEYASNTEVVLIVGKDSDADTVFNQMFNSPMYTPVFVQKGSMKALLEIVVTDIEVLRVKYYSLDVNKNAVKQAEVSSKEILGENTEVAESTPDTSEDTSNVPESESENQSEFFSGPTSLDIENDGLSNINQDSQQNNITENLILNSSVPSSAGVANPAMQDFSDEDSMLSIGDFGSQHSDTGFLDNEEDEKLQAYLKQQQEIKDAQESAEYINDGLSGNYDNIDFSTEPESDNWQDYEETPSEDASSYNAQEVDEPISSTQEETSGTQSNVDIVLACKGSGATKSIVDEAIKITNEDNASVLIIDLDTKENGILSFIDLNEFYQRKCDNGISKRRVYTEDGVGVLSNGYGNKVKSAELLDLLSSGVLDEYDVVYIDCPIECMSVLSEDILKLCNVMVMTGSDYSQLVSTSLGLTNRKSVSLGVERFVMSNCLIDITGEYVEEDISQIKKDFLFANGCWLNRVGL